MKMRHTETNSFIHAVDSLLHKYFQQWCLYRKEVQGAKRMGTIYGGYWSSRKMDWSGKVAPEK